MSTERIENIGAAGARWRRWGGVALTALSVVGFAALLLSGAPRAYRLGLALPIGLAAALLLEARQRTCVALCAVGRREPTRDRPGVVPTLDEQRVLRARSVAIVSGSTLIGALVAGLLTLV